MDIFTTALTKVVPVTIKPSSLKVKALLKEPSTNGLTNDAHHLENHDYYFISSKKNNDKHSSNKQQTPDEEPCEQGIKASEDVIIHKEEILHPKPDSNTPKDDDIPHLDVFV